jgi:ribosome-binding factor A
MPKVRTGRVGEQLKKELSQIFLSEFKDPGKGFMTITGVEINTDLSLAKVFISVLGNQEQREATLHALARGKGFIRTELGKRMRLRHVPELQFHFDPSVEYGSRIEALLQSLNNKSNE